MKIMSTMIDGRLKEVPILTAQHLIALERIRAGKQPNCPLSIIKDLVSLGWLEVKHGEKR